MTAPRLLLGALSASALLLAGCVVAPTPHYPAYYGPTVSVAPPPPRVEYAPPPPATGYVWITGFWNWTGGRHEWVPGRWEEPRPGHVWVPHHWDRDGDGWRQGGGRWQPDERRGDDRHDRRERW